MGEVILGMPGPWAANYREKADHYTTKIGGLPDWPIPEVDISPVLLRCRSCRGRLCLVAQVYAPIASPKLNFEERVIYVLGCPMPECGSNPCSWRALRAQKCRGGMLPEGNIPEAARLEENSTSISKASNWWEERLSTTGLGGQEDESDAGMDLREMAQALSEAASRAAHSSKRNRSKKSKASVKMAGVESGVLDASISVAPCFYIYSQTEQPMDEKTAVCDSLSSLSVKENHVAATDPEGKEKWEGESYEYDRALGADRTYLKFKKRMDAYPEQCFRYSYGGKPLLAATDLAEPETCKLCGSSRNYEMQLMPPLLYFLQHAADRSSALSSKEWSWMTLMVYTCSKSCCPSLCEGKSGSCSWGVAEEAIVIQDE